MQTDIDIMFKKIIFNKKYEEQKRLLKLYSNYKNIKINNNYKELEAKIYAKQGINNRKEKVDFEIQRIKKNLKNNGKNDPIVKNRIKFIEKAYIVYLLYSEDNKDDNILKYIINDIILLELDMDMKIGLWEELCEYVEKEITKEYDEEVLPMNRIKRND